MEAERESLAPYCGKRICVTAVFDRFGGTFSGKRGQTLLVQAVELAEDGSLLCGHTWIQQADNFVPLGAKKGERVKFDAMVMSYKKRLPLVQSDGTYMVLEYGLSLPTKIELIDRKNEPKPAPAPPPLPEAPQKKGRQKLEILQDLAALAKEAGGPAELRTMLAYLE
jgi:hypothetical protein